MYVGTDGWGPWGPKLPPAPSNTCTASGWGPSGPHMGEPPQSCSSDLGIEVREVTQPAHGLAALMEKPVYRPRVDSPAAWHTPFSPAPRSRQSGGGEPTVPGCPPDPAIHSSTAIATKCPLGSSEDGLRPTGHRVLSLPAPDPALDTKPSSESGLSSSFLFPRVLSCSLLTPYNDKVTETGSLGCSRIPSIGPLAGPGRLVRAGP